MHLNVLFYLRANYLQKSDSLHHAYLSSVNLDSTQIILAYFKMCKLAFWVSAVGECFSHNIMLQGGVYYNAYFSYLMFDIQCCKHIDKVQKHSLVSFYEISSMSINISLILKLAYSNSLIIWGT